MILQLFFDKLSILSNRFRAWHDGKRTLRTVFCVIVFGDNTIGGQEGEVTQKLVCDVFGLDLTK